MPENLQIIPALREAKWPGLSYQRQVVAPDATELARLPLLAGTEQYAESWIVNWHNMSKKQLAEEVAIYYIDDVVVSGDGQLWLSDRLLVDPEIMPAYVAQGLAVDTNPIARLAKDRKLPVRVIDDPCLVAVGHGTHVYGHFLIEMLFRLLVAKRACAYSNVQYRVLLQHHSPPWLLYILERYLGVMLPQIEFIDPGAEQIHLKHALVPGRIAQEDCFPPFANFLLDKLLRDLPLRPTRRLLDRIFVLRNRFVNPAAPFRLCLNERRLAEIANRNFGFVAVTIEKSEWLDQVGMFEQADVILGQAGSGLHNSLFSKRKSILASLGFMNLIQSQIGTLRGQQMAFLTQDLKLNGEFTIDEDVFCRFLESVLNSKR